MGEPSSLIELYSERILALTTDIPHLERLSDPDGTGVVRSPLCGSTVTVDLCLDGEAITAFGQSVKACALGQASASVVGAQAVGATLEQMRRGRDELQAMLTEGGPAPSAPFEDLEVLLPARDYRNRHASILLAFDATLKAGAEAQSKKTLVATEQ